MKKYFLHRFKYIISDFVIDIHVYSITEHFRRCKRNPRIRNATEPMTGEVLLDTGLVSNDNLKIKIYEEIQKKISDFLKM